MLQTKNIRAGLVTEALAIAMGVEGATLDNTAILGLERIDGLTNEYCRTCIY